MSIVAKTITLDGLLGNEATIYYCIKIDAEGAELKVLRGTRNILRRTKYLVAEIARNTKDVLEELREAGFKCKRASLRSCVLCKRPLG